ncbi:methyl-accepting chemotaxis protein [Paenibacillus thermoaerophilus]|uniref:Methyl-accepting chemotaxis protein n=1 Tax=Paenibacillus thermoaerophilus TaxID=1215385 RepID=A0ABW2UX93_9BACL|nr:methyl-accepting chemotaxis protein [Paenibacillus thermoaerophilus]TMV17350.1 methyl-accepting chemotaxis protein [Paenibacillus thermoaerophilus]
MKKQWKNWSEKGQRLLEKTKRNIAEGGGGKSESIRESIKGLSRISLTNSVGTKLFLIMLVSIVSIVLVVGLVSYAISKDTIKNKVAQSSEEAVVQASEKLDLLFKGYEEVTMQLMVNKDIQELLNVYESTAESSFDRLETRRKIGDVMNNFYLTNNTFNSMTILDMKGRTIQSAGSANFGETTGEEAWFKQIVDAGGQAVWLDTKPNGYSGGGGGSTAPSFAVGRLIRSQVSGNLTAVLLAEIKVTALSDQLRELTFGGNGISLMIGKEGKIAVHQDFAKIGEDSPVSIEVNEENPRGAVTDDNLESLVAYNRSPLTGWTLIGIVPEADLVKEAGRIFIVTIVSVLVAAAVAAVLGMWVVRMVGRPLAQLRDLMQEGASGNLTVRMQAKSRDEIGQVSISFNQMMGQISELVRRSNQSALEVLNTSSELSEAARKTALSAREIATATEEIATGATSLAVESEKGNEMTTAIGEQMQKVIASNLDMGRAAAEVQQSSEQGTAYMAGLIGKTNETETMTREMSERVDKLKESAGSIRKILGMLENITKQTNILSLNATIEAARAGAAGKGFMVVADEIRKLADQSRESINVVGQITDAIQREVDSTVESLASAQPLFREQVAAVREADAIFRQVQERMLQFIQQLDETSASIAMLDNSQQVLSNAMANVSAVAQEASATSEEVASLSNEQTNISASLVRQAETLEQLSKSLQDQLAKFRVD